MFKSATIAASILAASAALTTTAQAQDVKALAMEGKGVMMSFGKTLKGALVGAMKSGGPIKALHVCNVDAPVIADKISTKSGWTVARSSHKLRNSANTADAFTKAAIEDFLARQAKGEKPKTMIKTGIIEQGGKKSFRMVKAIGTKGVCLKCHGSAVKPEVLKKIKELYPDDKATGFKAGEMRGVFVLTKALN